MVQLIFLIILFLVMIALYWNGSSGVLRHDSLYTSKVSIGNKWNGRQVKFADERAERFIPVDGAGRDLDPIDTTGKITNKPPWYKTSFIPGAKMMARYRRGW